MNLTDLSSPVTRSDAYSSDVIGSTLNNSFFRDRIYKNKKNKKKISVFDSRINKSFLVTS